jgi:type I restriction enzyme M protein
MARPRAKNDKKRGAQTGSSFEQAFKGIDDMLRKEAGCTTELDYTEQTSWLLFLKYLDGLEEDRATEAQLEGRSYEYILQRQYRWESWAAPKGRDGKLDHDKALSGEDLIDFVDRKLFPYLHGFKGRAAGSNTIEYKIGEIFGEIKNRIKSGYNLREIIDRIDELRFRSQSEKFELSHLYEAKIRNMGNAGRNGGEYYTPRPLIRAMVRVVKPRIGERIYDGACGSAGFLCESYEYLKASKELSTKDVRTLQEKTFFGKEKKSLAYVIAIMNMILHGIEAPNVIHTNTLSENLADIQEKDRMDVVLANPPFGGSERPEVQENFPIRTGGPPSSSSSTSSRSSRPGVGPASSSRTPSSPTPTTHPLPYANYSSKAVSSPPSSTAPPAPSRARASRPWSSSSRRASLVGRSGTTSSIPAAVSARPIP